MRSPEDREQARIRAMARLIGEAALLPRFIDDLEDKEVKVLIAVAEGLPLNDIVKTGNVFSVTHLKKKIYYPLQKKLGARTMAHAVRNGYEEGVIPFAPARPTIVRPLTDTHKDVLRLISFGAANRDICDILGIATGTATNHVIEIKSRYGVATNERATSVGIELEDVPLDLAA